MRMAFDEADRPDLYARSREERGLDPTEEEDDSDDATLAVWEPSTD